MAVADETVNDGSLVVRTFGVVYLAVRSLMSNRKQSSDVIRYATTCVCTVAWLAFSPAVAVAQGTAADMRWFVGGLGGLTFGTETSGAIGGQFGVRVGPGLFAIGEVGRMQNVIPNEVNDDLRDFADQVEEVLGVPIALDVSVPATYGFGGLRWVQPRPGIALFLEGGVGVGDVHIKVEEAEVLGLDVTDEVENAIGDDDNATKFLLALGFGITTRLGQAAVLDAGYRYSRIATEDPSINTSMVYVAVKFGR